MIEEKGFKEVLGESLNSIKNIPQAGKEIEIQRATAKALIGLGLVLGDIQERIGEANKNIQIFNSESGKLTKRLIWWTAIMALATVINIWIGAKIWPF